MCKKKPTSGGRTKKKAEVSLVRSSAAEYLTFVAAGGQDSVEAVYADENVWLSQKMTRVLYDVETHTVNYHLKKVFDDHNNLSAIIAMGFKIENECDQRCETLFTDFASTGTMMPCTNWGNISPFKVPLPTKPIAAAFTRIIQPMLDHIHANLHQSRILATLRDTLLPKLLSGELSVAAANHQIT